MYKETERRRGLEAEALHGPLHLQHGAVRPGEAANPGLHGGHGHQAGDSHQVSTFVLSITLF